MTTTQQTTQSSARTPLTLLTPEPFTWAGKILQDENFEFSQDHQDDCECFFRAIGGQNWMEKRSAIAQAMRTFLPENWNTDTLDTFANEHQVENPDCQDTSMAAMSKVFKCPIIVFMANEHNKIYSVQEYNAVGDYSTYTPSTHIPAKLLISRPNLKTQPITILHKLMDNEDHYYRLFLKND